MRNSCIEEGDHSHTKEDVPEIRRCYTLMLKSRRDGFYAPRNPQYFPAKVPFSRCSFHFSTCGGEPRRGSEYVCCCYITKEGYG